MITSIANPVGSEVRSTQNSFLREDSSFSQYACGDRELGVVKRRRGDAKLRYYTGRQTFLVQGPGAFDGAAEPRLGADKAGTRPRRHLLPVIDRPPPQRPATYEPRNSPTCSLGLLFAWFPSRPEPP